MIPVIDIFAGSGGLGEGFSAYIDGDGQQPFDLRLSVEKNHSAARTLKLRCFFRQFAPADVPEAYYDVLRGEMDEEALYKIKEYRTQSKLAEERVWCTELGHSDVPQRKVRKRIRQALAQSENWVLLGGPPCQAYSLAGRSRNRGNLSYKPEKDVRQHLYLEYLQVIADHQPAVFVMENVKGLLSATLRNKHIFLRMLKDLQYPSKALKRVGRDIARRAGASGYNILPLVRPSVLGDTTSDPKDFIVCAENHGIPQARHRVILLGVRDDIGGIKPWKLNARDPVPAGAVLRHLPRVRAGLSRCQDSDGKWDANLLDALKQRWFRSDMGAAGEDVQTRIRKVLSDLAPPKNGQGGEFIPFEAGSDYEGDWFLDPRLRGVCNFSSRHHMPMDFHRYLFASCFAQVRRRSPCLRDFPHDLLPKHTNVARAMGTDYFADRFRVQLDDAPATTVTSHISKDGHYYIHPDPTQCRSLTVREAARLQTFPDNFFFAGPRTAQYIQVGNAVPPLLARQVAEIVWNLLEQCGAAS